MKKMWIILTVVATLLGSLGVYKAVKSICNRHFYQWQPWCSAPKEFEVYTHYFYVKYGDDKAVGIGRDLFSGGIDQCDPQESGVVKNEIPTGFHIIYAAIQERKIYEADVNFSQEELNVLRSKFENGYQCYEGRDYFSSFCICILPGGRLRFILVGERQKRKETLDFEYTAEETHKIDDDILYGMKSSPAYGSKWWNSVDEFFDFMTFDGDCFEDLDTIKSKYGKITYARLKYQREKNFPMEIWEKYFVRFNYKMAFSHEKDNVVCTCNVNAYTNVERVMLDFENNPSNIIENPSYIRESIWGWIDGNISYTAKLYFDENEVFDIFDRAFGNNPTQEGILTYKVNKNSDSIDVYLKVGDMSIPFEKTQVNIYARDMKTGEYTDVYNNIEGEEHQQFTGYRYY